MTERNQSMPLDINDNNPLNISIKNELSYILTLIQNAENLSKNDSELTSDAIEIMNLSPLDLISTIEEYQEFSFLYFTLGQNSELRMDFHQSSMNQLNLQDVKKLIHPLIDNNKVMFTFSNQKSTHFESNEYHLTNKMVFREFRSIIDRQNGNVYDILDPETIAILSNIFEKSVFVNEFTHTILEYKKYINHHSDDVPNELWRETMPVFGPIIHAHTTLNWTFIIILVHVIFSHRI